MRTSYKDGEKSRIVEGMENVIHDYRGTVSCVCAKTGTEGEMAYGGFERAERPDLTIGGWCHTVL